MPGEPLSKFDVASARLRALGLTLRALPGEFVVNFRNGGDATAYVAAELDEAIAVREAMAAAAQRPFDLGEGRRHSLSSTKRYRRRFIRRHNNWFRRRSLRRERGD